MHPEFWVVTGFNGNKEIIFYQEKSKKGEPCVCKCTSSSRCVTQVFSEVAMHVSFIYFHALSGLKSESHA